MPGEETASIPKAALQTVNPCTGAPVQPPRCLPITQGAQQQPRAAPVQLQQRIHESQELLLCCRPPPASEHTGRAARCARCAREAPHPVLSRKGERGGSTLGSSGQHQGTSSSCPRAVGQIPAQPALSYSKQAAPSLQLKGIQNLSSLRGWQLSQGIKSSVVFPILNAGTTAGRERYFVLQVLSDL